jgi:hypothetical protein
MKEKTDITGKYLEARGFVQQRQEPNLYLYSQGNFVVEMWRVDTPKGTQWDYRCVNTDPLWTRIVRAYDFIRNFYQSYKDYDAYRNAFNYEIKDRNHENGPMVLV